MNAGRAGLRVGLKLTPADVSTLPHFLAARQRRSATVRKSIGFQSDLRLQIPLVAAARGGSITS